MNYFYLGDAWYETEPKSEEEERTGCMSQLRLMHYLFKDCVMANTLCEKIIRTDVCDEIVSPFDEETGAWDDEYQYFIVDLSLDEDYTAELIRKANTDIYLRYSETYDVYIMSVGNIGTHRSYVMTDLYVTDDYDKDCMKDFYKEA